MKTINILTIGLIVISFFITIILFPYYFKKEYYIVFRKSGTIAGYNNHGRLDGQLIIFKNGKVQKIANYKDGSKIGYESDFYPNGRLLNKRLYYVGSPFVQETHYYKNGAINYQQTIFKNKKFGGFYLYSIDGKIRSYSSFDIRGKLFSTFKYDNSGNITLIDEPICVLTYSLDVKTDSIVQLNFEEKHHNIRDQYVIIARPPGTQFAVYVFINKRPYKKFTINGDIVKINNPFPKNGLNDILMRMNVFYHGKKLIDSTGADLSILRE